MNFLADADASRQFAFFVFVAVFLLAQMWRGWRNGVMRQLCNLLALLSAYVAAWFGGGLLVPLLRPLGYPDMVLSLAGSCLFAIAVYLVIYAVSVIVFKKTSQQDVGIFRFGYGAAGALVGGVAGLLFIWGVVVVIRLLGTVAESEIEASRLALEKPVLQHSQPAKLPTPPNATVRGLAQMKHSLEHGVTGPVVDYIDPMPHKTYEIMGKIGRIVSSPASTDRFFHFPGAQSLADHPKIAALYKDPSVIKEINAKNYLGLLKNQRVVDAVNDPELAALIRRFEFEKALDYSLDTAQKGTPTSGKN
jgi:uncharacterized membrane protein required for colicin V production